MTFTTLLPTAIDFYAVIDGKQAQTLIRHCRRPLYRIGWIEFGHTQAQNNFFN